MLSKAARAEGVRLRNELQAADVRVVVAAEAWYDGLPASKTQLMLAVHQRRTAVHRLAIYEEGRLRVLHARWTSHGV